MGFPGPLASAPSQGAGVASGAEWSQVLASRTSEFSGNIVTSKTPSLFGLFASGQARHK